MRLFSLYRVELRRLLLSKFTWMITILCLLTPLLGYTIYPITGVSIMSNRYIANSVLAGTTFGAVLWAILTVFETSRLHRSGVDILTDAIAFPARLSVAKILALLTTSAFTTMITALIYLPYTIEKMAYLFTLDFYLINFAILMFPTWWISILLADAFYQITRRIELTIMLYVLFACFSFRCFLHFDYYSCWLTPLITSYSDGFVSLWPVRVALYSRTIWLSLCFGLWLVSILCIRRYQRGLFFSFIKTQKKAFVLFFAALSIFLGGYLWHIQPFIDHGPEEYVVMDNGILVLATIRNSRFSLKTNSTLGSISVRAEYDIEVPAKGETVLRLNSGYKITNMSYDGKAVSFQTSNDEINGERATYFTLPATYGKTLIIEYKGIPTQANCWKNIVSDSVDKNYVVLGGTSVFPLIDSYALQGQTIAEFTIPDDLLPFLDYEPLTCYTDNGDGTKTWVAECSNTYVREFSAANYLIDTIPVDDFEIDFAYGKAYQDIVADSGVKQAVQDVFTYCGEHYGKLPWTENDHMLLQQRSAMFRGGVASSGVSQWFETVLSPDTLNDLDKGSSATEVFIHEMVHQWWGGFGLHCTREELWTNEGLTVYSTYRIVKELYGDLYAQQYYVDTWKTAVENQNRNFYNRHPEYFTLLPEFYQSIVNESNITINRYQRMPLMILKAEQLVGGEEEMDKILQKMYTDSNLFLENDFSYQDFLDYCGLTEEELCLE